MTGGCVSNIRSWHTDHDLIAVVAPTDPADPTAVFRGDLAEGVGDPGDRRRIDSGRVGPEH